MQARAPGRGQLGMVDKAKAWGAGAVAWGLLPFMLGGCAATVDSGREHDPWRQALAGAGCAAQAPAVPQRLQAVQHDLGQAGLELRLVGCESVAGKQALRFDPWVVDGRRAAQVVRGPMANGQVLDLGWPQGRRQAAALPDEQVSPDVIFNRQWWRAVLARHGLEPVAGDWHSYAARP